MRRTFLLVGIVLAASVVSAQLAPLQLAVTDENGLAVSGAIVQLQGTTPLRCETDHSGRCVLRVPAGSYRVTINKDGFYAVTTNLSFPAVSHLDLTLTHVQEIKERVDVVASTPQVDPAQVANTQSLDSEEIVNIPYPTTRDIRQILEFVPGVVRDTGGQAHVAGGSTYQTLNTLDGFDITNPAFGTLDLRFSSDAIRAIDVQQSRYSAEFGKASAGVIAFATRTGDDHLRFNATNFIPSFQTKKSLNFDKWTPRATFSGPIKKGRAWFLLAPDGEYDHNLVKDLPSGADTNVVWRATNLAKVQVNLTQSNVLTGSFLFNHLHSDYDGLSLLNPKQTTLVQDHDVYFGAIRDQHYFHNGTLFEIGAAVDSYHDAADPLGVAPYVLSPGLNQGNFFESFHGNSRRVEGITNLYLPPQHLAGRHEIRLGFEADRRDNYERILRRDITILRANGTRDSQIVYSCGIVPCAPGAASLASFTQNDVELGAYLQDRWSPAERLLIQPGIRFDHESFTGRTVFSPRLGLTYMLKGDTKLSAGVGVFYDTANLEKIGRALQGERFQYVYDSTGTGLISPPLPTTFSFNRSTLQLPRFLNWSVGVERRMPVSIFNRGPQRALFWLDGVVVSLQYMQRDGSRIFAYQDLSTTPRVGDYLLGNTRHDHYRALQLSARRHFKQDYEVFLAYTRSRASANEVVDPTLDNPVFSPQAPGPLPWDVPNSMVGWGFVPFPFTRKWDIAWSFDWRTGFPFSVVNQNQEIVGLPNSRRFPDYFSLNLFLERRFTVRELNLALRFGFEDITGRNNPFLVDNNINSPTFLQYLAWTGRSFTARIRFLGRKK